MSQSMAVHNLVKCSSISKYKIMVHLRFCEIRCVGHDFPCFESYFANIELIN